MLMKNHKDIIALNLPNISIVGNIENSNFKNAKAIHEATENSITWLKGLPENYNEILKSTRSNIIVCNSVLEIENKILTDKTIILTKDPKNTFIKIISCLFESKIIRTIHPTAIIDKESIIGVNVHIGPNVIIYKSVIGDNSIILGNNFIFENTVIGQNVTIYPGTVVGSDGFGYSRNEDGTLEKFPHFGGVIIEDNVEIGSNSSIDKGTLGNTIIKSGVKIDNLVHIAHNVIIGENTLVIANCMIGGSVKIGKNCWISPSTNILNGLQIGDNVMTGMNSTVTKSIPSNETWAGSPAKPLNEFKELQNKLKNL
jgi:UDP-3-O-[3-hydroxymyristoyl] glucosamine N-acyltransferase